MQNNSRESSGDRWQWDLVTWTVIVLVATVVFVLVVMLWPHSFDPFER